MVIYTEEINMIGFTIETNQEDEFIELYIEDEASIQIEMNQENMTNLSNRLHNELLDAHRIMRERGWD